MIYIISTRYHVLFLFFFFYDTATAEIYTLSLHDALPISICPSMPVRSSGRRVVKSPFFSARDRKSTRLNSSHSSISYAVFCLKKKNNAAVGDFPVARLFQLREVVLERTVIRRARVHEPEV